jgi:hypothetical protein
MISLLSIVRGKQHSWHGCRPLSAAERMERYSHRSAADMQQRENLAAGTPRARVVDGRLVLVALPGTVNKLPKDNA